MTELGWNRNVEIKRETMSDVDTSATLLQRTQLDSDGDGTQNTAKNSKHFNLVDSPSPHKKWEATTNEVDPPPPPPPPLETNREANIPESRKAFRIRLSLIPRLKGDVVYTWSHLNCQLPPKTSCFKEPEFGNYLIHHVSGVVRSGELWALMGPSGAGKTTLLNILNFRSHPSLIITGDRCINGSPVGPELMSSVSAYVHQDDIFYPSLTVREHLVFSSLLRLQSGFTKKERRARIDEVLHELGLWDVQDSYIGSATRFQGVSVGERKRLAFGAEILHDPVILFCDEPTTGLDTFMAQHVIEIMHRMVARGKIIVCTIHQPSTEVFAMFDNVYFLAEGRMMYAGSKNGAMDFFSERGFVCPITHNPADFYMRTISINPFYEEECRFRIEALADAYRTTDIFADISHEASQRFGKSVEISIIEKNARKYTISAFAQFRALYWRSCLLNVREPLLGSIRIFQCMLLGFFIAWIYYRKDERQYETDRATSISGLFVVCILFQILLPFYSVICTFSVEIPIFLREYWNGMYRSSVYFLAKTVVEIPFFSFYPVFFFPQIWWWAKLEGSIELLFSHLLVLVCVSNAACSLGYCVSTHTRSIRKALNLSPAIVLPIITLCGAFVVKENLPAWFQWAHYISMAHLGAENLMIQQWKNVKNITQKDPLAPALFRNGTKLLEYYDYEQDNFNLNFAGLGLQFLILRIFAYIALYRKTRRS